MNDRVLIPFGDRYLAFPRDVFEEALRAGDPILAPSTQIPTATTRALLDADAAAQLVGCKPTTLLRLARVGRISHVKVGRLIRFNAETIIADLAQVRR